MNRSELKREAKAHIFTPRRPHPIGVTALHLIFMSALMMLIMELSDIGRFQAELAARLLEASEHMRQANTMATIHLPEMSITALGVFFFIVPWMFRWVLDLGYLYYVRGIVKGEALGFRSLFEGFNYVRKAIILRLIQVILVFGGLVLFVAPGIWTITAFSQANLLLLDHPKRGVIWCLRESERLMRGHKWEYFVLFLSFLGWLLLTITPLPFLNTAALLWYTPYTTFTYIGYYNRLTGQNSPDCETERSDM